MSSWAKTIPRTSANTPDLAGHTRKLKQMHKIAAVILGDFSQPREIFTLPDKVNPMELANNKIILTKTP